ncbi:hypothetical protein AVEN_202049-1 [Araneus ventricosus]|uniref:Uncharacterized protein n=1 Tax=Araneus ventricosus TaxID=182803 RepID=A0A4Y2X2C2_ARAVE|nr:hypothetical protein AVEN_202049-1 [Araneus ventricosus]
MSNLKSEKKIFFMLNVYISSGRILTRWQNLEEHRRYGRKRSIAALTRMSQEEDAVEPEEPALSAEKSAPSMEIDG